MNLSEGIARRALLLWNTLAEWNLKLNIYAASELISEAAVV